MNQRGVMWLTLLPYILGAVAVAGVLGTTYWKGREAGKEVIRAELVPQLAACNTRAQGLENAIATQNRAVAALKAEGDARTMKALEGIRKAQEGTKAARSEAGRLRELASAPRSPEASNCAAGDAVAEIRKGLR